MTSRVAIITGAARRIGAALARSLHSNGYNVLIHYHHSQKEAENLVAELNELRPTSASGVCADLLDPNSPRLIQEAVKSVWGRCDLLVNNASAFYSRALDEYSETDWDTLIGSNLKAPFFLSQSLAPMIKKNRGNIVNIVDVNAFRPRNNYALYCIAKAGNAMMTKALALELAPEIRVNGIAPGAILWPENAQHEEIVSPEKLENIPLGRMGGAASICETLDFLINPSSYLTGEIITVDGGQSVK